MISLSKNNILENLQENEELKLFIDTIDFSENSIFNVLFIDNKRIVDECIKYICVELEILDNKKFVIDVFKNRDIDLKSLHLQLDEFIRLTKKVYNSMIVLDLSFLESNKMYESEQIFLKLNQLRNTMMNFDFPIILIVPQEMKKVFMVCAPDFWSIRSSILSLDLDIEEKVVEEKKELVYEEIDHKNQLNFLLNQYRKLETQKNENSKWLLMSKCGEIGDFYFKHISIDEAQKYYKKAHKLSLEILNNQPDSIEAKRDLSVSLEKIADIYLQKGDIQKALDNYKDGLKLADSILEKRPDSIEAKRDIVVSYFKIANSYLELQKNKKALKYFKKALKITKENLEYLDFKNIHNILKDKIKKIGEQK